MFSGKFKFLAFIYFCVFIIIFAIGLVFQVSALAGLYRAVLGGLLFTGLLMIIIKIIKTFVIQDILKDFENGEEDPRGSNLDITIDNDPVLEYSNQELAASKQLDQDINSLASQQINPQFNQIINSDPERLAQIVKKMGFEDES